MSEIYYETVQRMRSEGEGPSVKFLTPRQCAEAYVRLRTRMEENGMLTLHEGRLWNALVRLYDRADHFIEVPSDLMLNKRLAGLVPVDQDCD